MLGTTCVRRNKWQIDLCLHDRGQFALGLLSPFFQALKRHFVLAEVDTLVLPELVDQPFDDTIVKIIPAKERITIRGLYLENAFSQLQDGDVESAAAQVIHRNGLIFLLVETV